MLTLEAKPFVPKFDIFPASADTFFALSGFTVMFTRDASGRGVTLNLGGQTAVRVN
ncbi:MAG: hypothetical protein ACT4P7_22760 [Gemmatimonadaceae bacterium]